jgi:hypothetical protein
MAFFALRRKVRLRIMRRSKKRKTVDFREAMALQG